MTIYIYIYIYMTNLLSIYIISSVSKHTNNVLTIHFNNMHLSCQLLILSAWCKFLTYLLTKKANDFQKINKIYTEQILLTYRYILKTSSWCLFLIYSQYTLLIYPRYALYLNEIKLNWTRVTICIKKMSLLIASYYYINQLIMCDIGSLPIGEVGSLVLRGK